MIQSFKVALVGFEPMLRHQSGPHAHHLSRSGNICYSYTFIIYSKLFQQFVNFLPVTFFLDKIVTFFL